MKYMKSNKNLSFARVCFVPGIWIVVVGIFIIAAWILLPCRCVDQRTEITELQDSILTAASHAEFRESIERLNAKGSLQEVLGLFTNQDARALYIFANHLTTPRNSNGSMSQALNTAVCKLPYDSMDSVLDLMTRVPDARIVEAVRAYSPDYFRARYPGRFFGTEPADNQEYVRFARRVAEIYMHNFANFDRNGKEALVRLTHDALTYPGRWSMIPDYMQRQLAKNLMNLIPRSQENTRGGEQVESWIKDTYLPIFAMELVANTRSGRYTQSFARYINEIGDNPQKRGRALRTLARLAPPADSWTTRYLIQSLEREDLQDNENEILLVMEAIPSRDFIPPLLERIEAENLSLGRIATNAFLKIDTWEEVFQTLPRPTQVRIALLGGKRYGNNQSLRKLYRFPGEEDFDILLSYLTLENAKSNVSFVREAVRRLEQMQSELVVEPVVNLMQDLVVSGESTRYWLLFGMCTRLMESVAQQSFWPEESYISPRSSRTGEDRSQRLVIQKETLSRIDAWLASSHI